MNAKKHKITSVQNRWRKKRRTNEKKWIGPSLFINSLVKAMQCKSHLMCHLYANAWNNQNKLKLDLDFDISWFSPVIMITFNAHRTIGIFSVYLQRRRQQRPPLLNCFSRDMMKFYFLMLLMCTFIEHCICTILSFFM